MEENERYSDIKTKFPDFVTHVDNLNKKIFSKVIILSIIFVICAIATFFIFPSLLFILSITYSLFGALFVAMGATKSTKEVVLLSVARWGYNEDLAKEFCNNGYHNAIGLVLIVISAVIQTIPK